ncbi:MAG TPA: LysE family transporter [Candidatus Binatia bacterium]|nr:LysE family transporter [Candidatus Binatia bacterium]
MSVYLLIEGILIGLVVAVPVGPLGLLCINRALSLGALCGLCSGLGVATADAIAAGIAALGITLVSDFLADHQFVLRLIGGSFLCYLGYKIYRTEAVSKVAVNSVNGLLSAFATTFFLTLSNPVTILSFVAIYAGWHVPSLHGRYVSAATLTVGVFTGSALWWVALFIGLTTFHEKFNLKFLFWVHRVSGAVIAGFGIVVLLSLSPLRKILGLEL